jgi:hypothetical protein
LDNCYKFIDINVVFVIIDIRSYFINKMPTPFTWGLK